MHSWLAIAAAFFLALCSPVLAQEKPMKIIAFGDSLTAGYGLAPEEAFPAKLEKRLKASGYSNVTVINEGISGDTTAGGISRLAWMLKEKPDLVILELGANDMLRGLDTKQAHDNLDSMITQIKAAGARVLLAGMKAPLNYGPEYAAKFNAIYPALAKKHDVPLYEFFLEGVALNRALILEDGLHPNAKGVEVMAEKIAPSVEKMLK